MTVSPMARLDQQLSHLESDFGDMAALQQGQRQQGGQRQGGQSNRRVSSGQFEEVWRIDLDELSSGVGCARARRALPFDCASAPFPWPGTAFRLCFRSLSLAWHCLSAVLSLPSLGLALPFGCASAPFPWPGTAFRLCFHCIPPPPRQYLTLWSSSGTSSTASQISSPRRLSVAAAVAAVELAWCGQLARTDCGSWCAAPLHSCTAVEGAGGGGQAKVLLLKCCPVAAVWLVCGWLGHRWWSLPGHRSSTPARPARYGTTRRRWRPQRLG